MIVLDFLRKHCFNRIRPKNLFMGMAILCALSLTLFRHWEIGWETLGYWFFARIFSETGMVNILGRSPFYVMYLSLFHWLGYPLSVTVEYIVTSLISIIAIIFLLRPYLGLSLSVFSVLLWLPFFQNSEPPALAFGVSLICFGIIARRIKNVNLALPLSYTFFVLAVMVRITNALFIIMFLLWDIAWIIRGKHFNFSLLRKVKLIYFLPLLLAEVLLLYCLIMQSGHRWNNAWFVTTTWFPNDGKSLSESCYLHAANIQYIGEKYPLSKNKDFYFTNQELFKGADTFTKALRTNPKFVISYAQRGLKDVFLTFEQFVGITAIYQRLGLSDIMGVYQKFGLGGFIFKITRWFIIILLSVALLYGALRYTFVLSDIPMALFIVGNMISAAATACAIPQQRYLLPLVPVLILSASWYGIIFSKFLSNKIKVSRFLAVLLAITIISVPRIFEWEKIISDFTSDLKQKDLKILEYHNSYSARGSEWYSFRNAYKTINPLIKQCNGLMTLETNFIGAFTDFDLSKLYDVYEIPPFGNYSESSNYNKLTKERVDCLLISKALKRTVGYGTNYHIRYENYIKPYADYLQSLGAKAYKIEPICGELIILKEDKKK